MAYNNGMKSQAENDVRDTIINPYYAVTLADYLFEAKKTALVKEDWVLANTKLIKEMGSSNWLKQLLVTLTTEPSENLTHMVMSPRQAVTLSERLAGKHDPTIDTASWIKANVKLIDELGAEQWLWQLLKVLETGGVVE